MTQTNAVCLLTDEWLLNRLNKTRFDQAIMVYGSLRDLNDERPDVRYCLLVTAAANPLRHLN
jgi:hypothetical protein